MKNFFHAAADSLLAAYNNGRRGAQVYAPDLAHILNQLGDAYQATLATCPDDDTLTVGPVPGAQPAQMPPTCPGRDFPNPENFHNDAPT